jgi:hypothetical protein
VCGACMCLACVCIWKGSLRSVYMCECMCLCVYTIMFRCIYVNLYACTYTRAHKYAIISRLFQTHKECIPSRKPATHTSEPAATCYSQKVEKRNLGHAKYTIHMYTQIQTQKQTQTQTQARTHTCGGWYSAGSKYLCTMAVKIVFATLALVGLLTEI